MPIDRVKAKLHRAMTVAELIEELERYPEDAVPGFVVDYGDYTHTMQFLPVTNVTAPGDGERLEETAYSKSGLRVRDRDEYDPENEDDKPDPDAPKIVLLT